MLTEPETAPIGYRGTPVMASTPAPISLHAVNGWRGPGALAIAFGHFCVAVDIFPYQTVAPIALLVDLFFVLSGLLIAQVYSEKLSSISAMPAYIVRRFGRIWPVHAVTLAVLVAYELFKLGLHMVSGQHFSSQPFAADGANLPHAIWTNLLLVHSLGVHDRETWNFPSWSLSVEFFTYSVFALFCLTGPVTRRVASVITIFAALTILFIAAPDQMRSTYDYGIFRCLAGFFAGTLLHDIARRWQLPHWRFPTLVEVAAILLVGVWLRLCAGTQATFAAPLIFCLFIAAFLPGRGLISRLLITKPPQLLADLSFTIYMVHAIVLIGFMAGLHEYERLSGNALFVMMRNPLAGHSGAMPMLQVAHLANGTVVVAILVAYMASVIALAYGAYRFVEKPGRAFFGALAQRLSTPRPSSPAGPKLMGAAR